MNPLRHLWFVLLLLLAVPAVAVIETYEFSSRDLEARYHQLSQELRCPKCQNQNIADSTAPIAQDLRRLLHQQLEAGASDEEVSQFMVARYGEFVLYRPQFSGVTALLWLAPLILFFAAAVGVFLLLRARDTGPADAGTMSEADQQRLRQLLSDSEEGS